ncbi:hypothetical protein MHM98_17470 [Psychrobium sp. MM17-31]|uniref:hypothetical protein n=1 Tax=Psychrobium sp. MM17-31 TaxID=2917758 RepID=UPI001EF69E67|nr:hypothetical protein [Psychrobium sp. MM17-31]MCG7533120.1 hypothetical protein [Psychrobium sp. MM17-31]
MPSNNPLFSLKTLVIPALMVTGLSACGGSSDSSGEGYVTFYNASANAPAIFLTLDENLDEDGTDYFEQTYNSVSFGQTGGDKLLETNNYAMELAWQSDDSIARDDLTKVYESSIEITSDNIQFVVLTQDITNPEVLTYTIPVIDDETDTDDDLFNMRLLNLHQSQANIDIYLSKSDETFNEATLIGQTAYGQLTDNAKFEQDDYIFYITNSGSDEVLYTSDEVNYSFASQYVMVVRENQGVGSSPFVIDRVSSASAIEYANDGAQAKLTVFNGIEQHDLISDYQGTLDVHLDGYNQTPDFANLAQGQFSESIITDRGDYSLELTLPGTQEFLLKNHLVTLKENVDRTVFFYLEEENVDHDGDGNVDENNDGIVDEIEITINSLVVDNSTHQGIYEHGVNIINFVDDEDFSTVNFYFVRSDEIIDTAANKKSVDFGEPQNILLLNNTYTIYAVAKRDSSDILLISQELVLDEESEEQFLILEEDAASASGYKLTLANQTR